MLTTNLEQLTVAGWLLAAAALSATVLVSIPLGTWALDALGRSTLRAWRDPIVYLLAVPAFGAALLVFWIGARLLHRLGVPVQRDRGVRSRHEAATEARHGARDRS